MKTFLETLNVFSYCRSLGVPLWSCPQFLFMLMGAVVIGVIVATRAIATRYTDPQIAVLIVLALSAFLMTVAFVIVRAFERVVESRIREQETAAELLRLKDQFVFVAAHELRAPASAIQWAVELLKKKSDGLGEKEKASIGTITASSDRLMRLVDDLLEVARVESGTIQVKEEIVSLSEIIAQAVAVARELSEKKHIVIDNRVRDDVLRVRADATRLQEVVDNLLSNALKYTPADGSVRISAQEESDGMVAVHVADTGMGIRPEDRKNMFQKFWRAKESHDIQGTGLGLFIVKHLIELMGGTVWFTSEPGKGTTFSFTLKRA